MTCPHCGADASAGQKFCPKCSRLVDSPLLKIKQQIDAAREEIRRDLNAARSVRFSPPPPPPTHQQLARPQYHVRDATPDYPPPSLPSPSNYAPQTPSQPTQELMERAQRALNKRQRKKQRDEGITRTQAQHTDATHRFDPSATAQHAARDAAATNAATAAGAIPERFKRPASFAVLALLDLFAAMVFAYNAVRLTNLYTEPRPPIIEFYRILSGAAGFLFLLTAFGMWKMHPFGRFFQRPLLLPVALWVPFGTIYAVGTWFYLGSAAVRLYFSSRSPRSLNPKELAAWRTTEKTAPVFAVLLFVFGFIPGLAYATFISSTLPSIIEAGTRQFPQVFGPLTGAPSLEGGATAPAVESGPAAEPAPTGDPASVAVSEIRTMQRAQAVYSGLNEGYYDRLECVLAPAACIRNGDGRNSAVLLDPRFKEIERNGFLYTLYLFGVPAVRSETASSTSMRGYAYRAVPVGGVGTGYCGDETGMVCSYDTQTFASDRGNGGRCPNVCDLVQP
jgi:hypothetical protein